MFANRNFTALYVALAILIGAGGMYSAMTFFNFNESTIIVDQTNEDETVTYEQLIDKINKAYQIIDERFVEEVDHQKLLEGAIQGMLETLDDPYSVYMDQKTAKHFMESLDSHFSGIGAEVSMTDGKVTIVAPFRDSPAEKAGIRPNDKVLKVDGESIDGLNLNEAVLKIRGEKGTVVKLTIERPGVNEPIEISVTRDDIPLETVRATTIERGNKKIGLIEIMSFSEGTASDFEEELNNFEKEGIAGLIIDVRGNPGGYLRSVQEIGHLLVPGGEPIVQIENRKGERERYISTLKEKKAYPIITLINNGSASASEILAAALKEAGGYDVVGETTFGKGTVQQPFQLGDGSEIKLTLYKWITSGGNYINDVGVSPTVEVKQPDYYYVAPLNVENELVFDMNNEQVKNAQIMLKGLGFETGRVDGYFDQQTKNAVIAFQKVHQLMQSGKIDKETAAAIQEKLLEAIRSKENDRQLNMAIELILYK